MQINFHPNQFFIKKPVLESQDSSRNLQQKEKIVNSTDIQNQS